MVHRLAFLLLLAVPMTLVAQAVDATVSAVSPNDTVAVAQAALERYFATRDQRPTELRPQLGCLRMAGEAKWCIPSSGDGVEPALQSLAIELAIPLGSATKVPPCGEATAARRQLRIESLRITDDSAQVNVSLWCMGNRRARGDGCRYYLTRQGSRWAIQPGKPITCFGS